MKHENPKISVLMSVYNGQDYLKAAIDSILTQTFEDFEFLIIDDCSTDDSWKILSAYAEQDPRIQLVKNSENVGLTKSLNKGLRLIKGAYVARQDADDVSLPQRLKKQADVLDGEQNCVLVSCNLRPIDAQGAIIKDLACQSELVPWYLLFYNRIAGHSQVMYRRDSVLSLDGYDEHHRYSQDYELWCRLSTLGSFTILPDVLLLRHHHTQSISASKAADQEALSLAQTQSNLKTLTNKDITLSEAKILQGFWQGHWFHHRFPQHRHLPFIDALLRDAAQQFIHDKQESGSIPSTLPNQIRKVIGRQYISWLQSPLTQHHSICSKAHITRYALAWTPFKVPKAWLIWLLRSPVDTINSLNQKMSRLHKTEHSLGAKS